MRTSVTLDDDVYAFASLYASAKRITLGKAVGELIRKAESAPSTEPAEILWSDSGLPMFPPTGNVITAEKIKELECELE